MSAPASRFVQIHTLHAHGPSLPNSDRTRRAKRISLGGTTRARISSQARKYAMRTDSGPHSLRNIPSIPLSVRSREMVSLRICQSLRQRDDADHPTIDAIESEMNRGLHGPKADAAESRQAIVLGLPEAEWLSAQANRIYQKSSSPAEARSMTSAIFGQTSRRSTTDANMQAFRQGLRLHAGVEAAVFGRRMTADPLANIHSALQVTHSIGVSPIESEMDYFQAMDDIVSHLRNDAAYMGENELTTAVYYGYICIDVPTLVSNLEGEDPDDWIESDRVLAAEIARRIVMLAATVPATGMRSQTAPFSYASTLLVEIGERQPR